MLCVYVPSAGIEPTTSRLRSGHTANCVTRASWRAARDLNPTQLVLETGLVPETATRGFEAETQKAGRVSSPGFVVRVISLRTMLSGRS